jgi:UDP-N-acetylmuramoylalanine--D-glutamate ligase
LPSVVTISVAQAPGADIALENGWLVERATGRTDAVFDLRRAPNLRGAHNAQNAAFAWAAARAVGLDDDAIAAGLISFPGLAHRMESLGRIGRVLFINDSKATNADAAEKALLSFRDIYWIVGGKAKDGGIEPLRPLFARIAKAYLIGAASDAFAQTLDGAVPFERSGTLDVAVKAAARDAALSAAPEPVVLLSPACASFDQFPNFEVRGNHFRAAVAALVAASPGSPA